MSLTTKEHLSLMLQTFKKLLSFKADKSEVVFKNEIATDDDIMDMLAGINMIKPLATSDGSIYTNKNGDIYTL